MAEIRAGNILSGNTGRRCSNPADSGPSRIIHERLQPSRGSFPPDTSSDLLCDAPGIAVVGLPRPDEKSLAGTRRTSVSRHRDEKDRSSLNEMRVFRPGVRELSRLATFLLLILTTAPPLLAGSPE